MNHLLHAFKTSIMYVSEAFAWIFSPNQDSYPIIGVSPFDGTPYRPSRWEE